MAWIATSDPPAIPSVLSPTRLRVARSGGVPVVSCCSGGGADGSSDLSVAAAAVFSVPSLLVVCCFGIPGSQPSALWSLFCSLLLRSALSRLPLPLWLTTGSAPLSLTPVSASWLLAGPLLLQDNPT